MSFLDKTFCIDATECKHAKNCDRYLSPKLKQKAKKWFKNHWFLVSYASMKDVCGTYTE